MRRKLLVWIGTMDLSQFVQLFKNLPWSARVAWAVGVPLMLAFTPGVVPEGWQAFAVAISFLLLVYAFITTARHFWKNRRSVSEFMPAIEPSHLVVFGLIGATFCLALAAGGYIWLRYRHADGMAPPLATRALVEIPKIKTAPSDIPKKLDAIDQALAIFKEELGPSIFKGMQLVSWGWRTALLANAGKDWHPYREDLKAWRSNYLEISQKLAKLQDDNEKYPDISALLAQSYSSEFVRALEAFHSAIWNIAGNTDKIDIPFFVDPKGAEFLKQLQQAESWEKGTAKKAIELRRELSQ